jgi:hypothetical protein
MTLLGSETLIADTMAIAAGARMGCVSCLLCVTRKRMLEMSSSTQSKSEVRAQGIAEVVEQLPYEALCSNSSTSREKGKKKN